MTTNCGSVSISGTSPWGCSNTAICDALETAQVAVGAVEKEVPGSGEDHRRHTDSQPAPEQPSPVRQPTVQSTAAAMTGAIVRDVPFANKARPNAIPITTHSRRGKAISRADDHPPEYERGQRNGDDVVIHHGRLIRDLRLKGDERRNGDDQKGVAWNEGARGSIGSGKR